MIANVTAGRKKHNIEVTGLYTHDLDQSWPTSTHRRACLRAALVYT
jgi:hypothetical protein